MDKDIDKIVEIGKVLLNTPTLRSIYKDKFEASWAYKELYAARNVKPSFS